MNETKEKGSQSVGEEKDLGDTLMPQDTDTSELQAISHAQLVALASQWLKRKCSVILTELGTQGEEPDAIGWQATHSILVECKTSIQDFRSDAQKWFRRDPALGVGQHRYFLSLPGVIAMNDLPNGWGLLELTGSRIRKVKESGTFDVNHRHEKALLLSTIRRIGKTAPEGVSIKCYTIETKNRSTLCVRPVHEATQTTSHV